MQINKIKTSPRLTVRTEIEKLPDGEVFTSPELAERLGIHPPTLGHMTKEFKDNVHKMGTVNYWGTKKAIVALKKHLSKEVK